MTICPTCQTLNPLDARVCLQCGCALNARCPHCQADLPQLARFCPACGQAVVETASPPARVLDSGERRIVTVLFADISGFTALSETLDPEQVRGLINACFDALVPFIEKYGGTVDKFIGDEIMALFGAPIAHEDDPSRALRAALEMMQALQGFNQRHTIQLDIHMGINTGLVIAGGIGSRGRQQYSVMGDAVNIAARLRSAAQNGQVLVGEDTYRFCAPLFDFEPCIRLQLPGKSELLCAYRVVRLKNHTGSLRGVMGLHSPMVGRAAELSALLVRSDAVLQGRGGVALIIGEPGLGKSRIANEWRSRVPQVRVVLGGCFSYGQNLAYHLAGEVLRAVLRLPADANEPETRAALQVLCLRLFGAAAERVYPYLGHLLALHLEETAAQHIRLLDPQTLQGMYRSAFQQLLLALSAETPLLLLLEDIHWADPSSVALFVSLLPLVREHPVIFCLIARPDYDAPGWRLVAASRESLTEQLTILELRALSESEGSLLVANLLEIESLPLATYQQILHKADGNPFFVEEIIRMLIERGALVFQDGRWTAQTDLSVLQIPDTLQGLLLARIDRLSEEMKQILRVAAVIGRQFLEQILAEVLHGSRLAFNLGHWLDSLKQQGLLIEMQPGKFAFHHALLQETVYRAMLNQDRRLVHQAVGEALERLSVGTVVDASLLAYHFMQARAAEKAVHYLQISAEQALIAYANAEAEQHCRAALEMLPDVSLRRAELLTALGESLFRQSRYTETLDVWGQAIYIFEQAQQIEQMAALYARAARVAWWSGKTPLSLELCQQGLHAAENHPPGAAVAALLNESARAFLFNGLLGQVDALCAQALTLARTLELPEIEIEAMTTQGLLARRQNHLSVAETLLRQAIARVQRTNLDSGARLMAAGRAYNNLAELLEEEYAQLADALEIYHQSFVCVARRRSPNEMLFVQNQIAFVQLLMGNFADCAAALPEMYQLAEGSATPSLGRVLLMRVEAVLIYARGDLPTARLMLQICCGQLRQLGDREQLARVLLNLAEVCLEQKDFAAAEQALDEAHTIAQHGLASFALVCTWQAILCAQQAKVNLAQAYLDEAEQSAQGPAVWYHLVRQLAQGYIFLAQGQPQAAAHTFWNLAQQQAN